MNCVVINTGLVDYQLALDFQERLHAARCAHECDDVVCYVEHPSVLTIGKHGKRANVLLADKELSERGVSLCRTGRGGDVTYHGPGQLVGYPIMNLREHAIGIREYVGRLEEAIISVLANEFALLSHRDASNSAGVWVGDKKICALGISVRKGVTMHGFALNVSTNLEHFRWINPCGSATGKVTSLEQETGEAIPLEFIAARVQHHLYELFGWSSGPGKLSDELKKGLSSGL